MKTKHQIHMEAAIERYDRQAVAQIIADRHPHGAQILAMGELEIDPPSVFVARPDGYRFHVRLRRCTHEGAWSCFANAARQAAFASTSAARERLLAADPRCAVTGEVLARSELDLDHADPWPFAAIARAFVVERAIDPAAVVYRLHADYDVSLLPDEIAADFVRYHDERAVLRLVKRDLNRAAFGARAQGGGS